MLHRLSCSMACGIFLDQGLNLCLLQWQMHSLPLSHQESSIHFLYKPFFVKIYGFSCENMTISWIKKKKPTNTKIFRDMRVQSHFGEYEGKISQHHAK